MEQRLTFISDPTDEFPNNTNNSFRTRIRNGLRLEGSGWHVALLSLTLPNSTRKDNPFLMNTKKELLRVGYTVTEYHTKVGEKYTDTSLTAHRDRVIDDDDIEHPVDTGVEYWTQIVDRIERDIKNKVDAVRSGVTTSVKPNPLVLVKRSMRPAFRWDGDELILEAAGSDTGHVSGSTTTLYSYLDMSFEVAEQWGFIRIHADDLMVGPNCTYVLDNVDITDDYPPRTSAAVIPGVSNPNGPAHRYESRFDRPTLATGQSNNRLVWDYTIPGKGKWVRFSRFAEWHFKRINDTFNNLHYHPTKAVLVYTNLQQSSIVGGSKVQLLRELVVQRGSEHGEHTYTEPLHLQWVPVSTHQTDIVEVQLADVNGTLLSLPKGKSLVTIGLKRL